MKIVHLCGLLVVLLATSCSASSVDRSPTEDDPLELHSISPLIRIPYTMWWSDDPSRSPANHFPVFRASQHGSNPLQCRLERSLARLECSETANGLGSTTYKRIASSKQLGKKLKAETGMTLWYLYTCSTGCGDSVPKRFALLLYEGG